jgi:hypothetical protein
MNFSHSLFYKLDEGIGSTVSDSLGNGPAGTIGGTLDNIWANAGGLTVDNPTHVTTAVGDNYIKLQNAYIDEMCDLSTLEGNSLVMMFWFRQATATISGGPMLIAYSEALENPNVTGFWAIGCNNDFTPQFVKKGGTALFSRSVGCIEALTASENDTWFAVSIQIDIFDGKCCVSGCLNGHPQRGMRMFDLELALPSADDESRGITLLAAANAASYVANVWGGTQVKRMFIGRTNGEQRHNIPKWAWDFYLNDTGINDWMVA